MSSPKPHLSALGPEAAAPRPKPRPTAEVTTRCKTIIPPLASRSLDTSRSQQHQRDAPSSSSASVHPRSYQQQQQQQANLSPSSTMAQAPPQQQRVLSSAMTGSSSSSASTQPLHPPPRSHSGSGFSHHDPVVLSPDLPTVPLPAVSQSHQGSPKSQVISHNGQDDHHAQRANADGGSAQDRSASQIAQPSFTAQRHFPRHEIGPSTSSAARLQPSDEQALDYRADSSGALNSQGHRFHGNGPVRSNAQAFPPSTFGSHSSVSMPKPAITTSFPSSAFPASNAGLLYWNSHEDSILLAAVERSANWSQLHARFHATSSVPRTSNALSHRFLKLHREGKTHYQPSDLGPLNPVSTSASGMARTPVKVVRCDAWSEEEMEIVRRGLAKGKDWAAICREYERAFGTKKRSREAIRKRMRNMIKASSGRGQEQEDGGKAWGQSSSYGASAYSHHASASSWPSVGMSAADAYPNGSLPRSSPSSLSGSQDHHHQDDYSPCTDDEEGDDYQYGDDADHCGRARGDLWSKHDDQLLLNSVARHRKGQVRWQKIVPEFNKSCDKQRTKKALENRIRYLKLTKQQSLDSLLTEAGASGPASGSYSSSEHRTLNPWLDEEIKLLRSSLARHPEVPYSYSGVYKDFFLAFPKSKRTQSALRHKCKQLVDLMGGKGGEEDESEQGDSELDAQGETDDEGKEAAADGRKRGWAGGDGDGRGRSRAKMQRQSWEDQAYEADQSYLDDSIDHSYGDLYETSAVEDLDGAWHASKVPSTRANHPAWNQQQHPPPPSSTLDTQELAVAVSYEASGVRIEGCIPGLEIMVFSPSCVMITTDIEQDLATSVHPDGLLPAFHLRCTEMGGVRAVVLPPNSTMRAAPVKIEKRTHAGEVEVEMALQTVITGLDGFVVSLTS